MALIKAPGHTPGSQMVYVALQSGKEVLLSGDVAWHMDGVRMNTGKDAPWIKEPPELMAAELNGSTASALPRKTFRSSSATMRNNVANISNRVSSATDSSDPSPSAIIGYRSIASTRQFAAKQ